MTWALTRMMTRAAGTGYQSSPKLVYLLEPGSGFTSFQVMLGGSQMSSFQNKLDRVML